MASSQKRAYHHGDLRQSLIDGAIALIQEAGVSDVSLRQVARQVGVSHNAPYRHFADKEALLAAVAEQGFRSLQSALEAARELAVTPAEQLTAIGMAYVKFAMTDPAHYRVMFGEYRNDSCEYPDLAHTAEQAFRVLVNTIATGQAAGDFRAADPIDLARVAWSLVHGQSMLLLDHKLSKQGEALESFLRFSSRMLIEGLANPLLGDIHPNLHFSEF